MGSRNSLLTQAGAIDVSLPVDADLSTKQYYAVKRDATTGNVVIASANSKNLGILQNKPSAAGDVAQVRVQGVSLAKITEAGSIVFGNFLTSISGGALEICDAAGEEFIAKLISNGTATGDLAEVLVIHGEVEASDA